MKREDALAELNATWKYRYDSEQFNRPEYWTIMKEAPYEGDCEDYALTLLWLMCDRSMFKFWIALITNEAQIRRVITKNGGGHAILKIGDDYCDNWTKEFVSWKTMSELGHKKYLWLYSPIGVALKMWMGSGREWVDNFLEREK
tara:strand:- start:882 stop:1313 length:432 start_codon:yes stop_codon:yes gene_type:complete